MVFIIYRLYVIFHVDSFILKVWWWSSGNSRIFQVSITPTCLIYLEEERITRSQNNEIYIIS